MDNNDLIKQLKSLPKSGLSDDRKFLVKERIFSRIEEQQGREPGLSVIGEKRVSFSDLFLKAKLATAVFGLIVFFASSVGTIAMVGAVRGSLPGDTLYPVKLGIEKTQVGFVANKENKIRLQTEFALRRLEELETIALNTENSIEKPGVAEAVHNFNKEVSAVKKNLSQLNSSTSKEAQADFEEKVVDKVEKRIAEVGKKISVLTSITDKINNGKELKELSERARESFDEAKDYFLNEDLGGAIERLVISDGIIQELVVASGSEEVLDGILENGKDRDNQ